MTTNEALAVRLRDFFSKRLRMLSHEEGLLISECIAALALPSAPAQDARDSARLDWLEAHPRDGSVRLSDGSFKAARLYAISADARWTLREAIDTAMEQEAK